MQTPIIPTYPLPKGYTTSGQLLIDRVLAGANIRYKESFSPAVTTRIKEELRVIRRTHTCDYFLLWSDIAKFCQEHNILTTPGRGSAANSIVNYCLGITHVDPLKFNPVAPMLFARFFNENLSLPRIDMDVEPNAVDLVYAFIDELIGDAYTSYRVPVEGRDNSKLKIDILGLRVLKQIHDLEDEHRCHLDWNTIPLNDAKTLQLFQDGNTDDIQFFDTTPVQNALRQIHHVNFWELVALFAINRPMQGSMELYVQCANSGLPYEPMLYQEQAMVATSKAWQDINHDEDFKHLLPFAHAYCQTLIAYRLAYLKSNNLC